MKKSKFSEGQIALAIKQTEGGTPFEEVCRKVGVNEATFYNWTKKYSGFVSSPKTVRFEGKQKV